MTKLCRVCVELMVLIAIPQIPIQTEMMKEMVSLENAMNFTLSAKPIGVVTADCCRQILRHGKGCVLAV